MLESNENPLDDTGARARLEAPSRWDAGIATMKAVRGNDFDRVGRPLSRLSPDFRQLLIEQAYGELLPRPGLSLKARELVTVGVLCVAGNSPVALKYHCAGMLNTGWTPRQLIEIIIQASAYGGFHAAFHGIQFFREVLREQSIDYRPDGADAVPASRAADGSLDRPAGPDASPGSDVCPDLTRLTAEFVDSELWMRPGLDPKDRQLATLGMVMAKSNQIEAVRNQLKACLRFGWSRTELIEILMQMTAYLGWPQTLVLVGSALEVLELCEAEGLPAAPEEGGGSGGARELTVAEGSRFDKWPRVWTSREYPPEQTFLSEIADIAPDLARYYTSVAARGVFARPDLDIKTRELATVAALAMSGWVIDAEPFKRHVKAALNAGAEREEVIEAVLQLLPYAGFVVAQQAMDRLGEVFRECPPRPPLGNGFAQLEAQL